MIQPFKGLESPVVILWGLDTIEEVVVIEARLLPGLRRQQRWLSICCLWASKTPGPGATICEFSQFFCEPTKVVGLHNRRFSPLVDSDAYVTIVCFLVQTVTQ